MLNITDVPKHETDTNSQRQALAAHAPAIAFMIAALIFMGLAVHDRFRLSKPLPGKIIPTVNASILLEGRSQFQGAAQAPYTLVEFGDYECPPCRHVQPKVQAQLKKFNSLVKFDFRQLPLTTLHPHAEAAAIAAESARSVDKFWLLHTRLYTADFSQPHAISEILAHSGVVLNIKSARLQLNKDSKLEKILNINSTPSFFLCCPNGSVLRLQGIESLGASIH